MEVLSGLNLGRGRGIFILEVDGPPLSLGFWPFPLFKLFWSEDKGIRLDKPEDEVNDEDEALRVGLILDGGGRFSEMITQSFSSISPKELLLVGKDENEVEDRFMAISMVSSRTSDFLFRLKILGMDRAPGIVGRPEFRVAESTDGKLSEVMQLDVD